MQPKKKSSTDFILLLSLVIPYYFQCLKKRYRLKEIKFHFTSQNRERKSRACVSLPVCMCVKKLCLAGVWRRIDFNSLKIRTNVGSAHFKGKVVVKYWHYERHTNGKYRPFSNPSLMTSIKSWE